jgi:hypothetical protein
LTLFVHVGYPKCGSTSFQAAAVKAVGINYPRAGRHHDEHIALPLALKGVDAWTAKFLSADWVTQQKDDLLDEVRSATGHVLVSSERLASLKQDQIDELRRLFDVDVKILFLIRDRDAFVSSLWRHAVYRHDYPGDIETLRRRLEKFRFESAITLFERVFPVNVFNIDTPDFQSDIAEVLGCRLEIERENTGVSMNAARLLQCAHAEMGSERFKSVFTKELKVQIASSTPACDQPMIEEFTDPIF